MNLFLFKKYQTQPETIKNRLVEHSNYKYEYERVKNICYLENAFHVYKLCKFATIWSNQVLDPIILLKDVNSPWQTTWVVDKLKLAENGHMWQVGWKIATPNDFCRVELDRVEEELCNVSPNIATNLFEPTP